MDHPLLRPLLERAEHDPGVIGIILHGSHAANAADEESDYDVICLLTEDEYAARLARGLPLDETTREGTRKTAEVAYTSPHELRGPSTPEWFRRGLATARILLDKTGEVDTLLREITTLAEPEAREEAAATFDGYLNGFYRSLKAARRGNELTARLEAAESLGYLVRMLFAIEGRVAPFPSRLPVALNALQQQGWKSGELQQLFLEILRTADLHSQQALEERVESLMRGRGYGHVVDAWDGEIERVRRF